MKVSIPIKMAKDILGYLAVTDTSDRRKRDIENYLLNKVGIVNEIKRLEREFEEVIE